MIRRIAPVVPLLLLSQSWLRAEPPAPPQSARITLEQVEVRAGPSPQFPVTGKLRLGDPVRVRGQESGWLAIDPPAGSLSWIPDFLVEPLLGSRRLVVLGEEVPIRVGVAGVQTPSQNEAKVKVQRGAQVDALGDKVHYEKSLWWPIRPVAGEIRYISPESIALPSPRTTEVAKVSPGAGVAPSTAAAAEKEPLWARAQQAEQEGRWDDAERIYAFLSQKHMQAGGDFRFAQVCAGRIEELRRSRRTTGAAPSRTAPSTLTSMSKSSGLPPDRTDVQPPPLPGSSMPGRIEPAPRRDVERTSGPGVLRRSSLSIDGGPTYALETTRGQLMYYVTPGRGLDLEPYVGRYVDLAGTARFRGDVRGAEHLTAARVVYLGR